MSSNSFWRQNVKDLLRDQSRERVYKLEPCVLCKSDKLRDLFWIYPPEGKYPPEGIYPPKGKKSFMPDFMFLIIQEYI